MKHLVPIALLVTACGSPMLETAESDLTHFRRSGWTTIQGRRVRGLSIAEQRRLGRSSASFVVEDPAALDALSRGENHVQLFVPTSAQSGDLFTVHRVSTSKSSFPFLVRDGRGSGNARVDTLFPSFHEYLTDDQVLRSRDGGAVKVIAEAGRPNSISAKGAIGLTTVEMRVVRAALLDPGLAGGHGIVFSFTALGQAALDAHTQCNTMGICDAYCYQTNANASCDPDVWDQGCCQPWEGAGGATLFNECADGVDNDDDGRTDSADTACGHSDYCDAPGTPLHAHRYESGADVGLFGEIALCTDFGESWTTEFWNRAHDMREIFHNIPGAPPTGSPDFDAWSGFPGNAKPVRIAAVGCWVIDDLAQAQQCRGLGGAACAPFTAGSAHPYPYAGADDSVSAYFTNVKNDVFHAMDKAGLKTPLHAAHVTVDLATFATASGEADAQHGFGSAGVWPGQPVVMAHEIGHTLNITHCHTSVVQTYPGGQQRWSLMGDDGADFCAVPPGDIESDQLGASEGGELYIRLREVMNEVDGEEVWLIHPPSFGNH